MVPFEVPPPRLRKGSHVRNSWELLAAVAVQKRTSANNEIRKPSAPQPSWASLKKTTHVSWGHQSTTNAVEEAVTSSYAINFGSNGTILCKLEWKSDYFLCLFACIHTTINGSAQVLEVVFIPFSRLNLLPFPFVCHQSWQAITVALFLCNIPSHFFRSLRGYDLKTWQQILVENFRILILWSTQQKFENSEEKGGEGA